MRGKQLVSRVCALSVRITPAHAGKTEGSAIHPGTGRDHPRACGENHQAYRTGWIQPGSPPRMRGKHNPIKQAQKKIRITPAHAGKTGTCCRYRTAKQDHPRACGENNVKR